MSLLNGIGELGTGISTLAGNALKDALDRTPTRQPLLSAAAAKPDDVGITDATPDPTAGGAAAPAKYMPLYEAASKRTGIPVDVLIAQAKQESSFNPNAVGPGGSIGLHQILPSTAQNPGWGLSAVDPKKLSDPATNINFAADYLRARAGAGADFNNPAVVDRALANFNGGGDPNYVANVRRYMGAA